MSLMDQIKLEEEELKKLEAEDGADNQEDDANQGGDDDDSAGEQHDGEEDEKDDEADSASEESDDGSDDDDGEEEADAKDAKKPNSNDVNAKLRLERKEKLKAQQELAEMRERMARIENPAQPKTESTPKQEEQKSETAEERIARLEQQLTERSEKDAAQDLRSQAVNEFIAIEKEFQQATPDYQQASEHMLRAMVTGVMHANPAASQQDAMQYVQNQVLKIAGTAAQRGQNPAEVLYQMSHDRYGYAPGVQKPAEEKKSAADKLRTVAKNKKKSATPLSGGGQNTKSSVTIDEADKMSVAQFSKMSASEIDELIAQAAS